MKKKILIVSYYFPPLGSIGYRRPLKFAKYLPDYGWEPFILTVRKGKDRIVDRSLIKEIPKGLKVYRTSSFEPFRYKSVIYNRMKGEGTHSSAMFFKRNAYYILKIFRIFLGKFMVPDNKIGWLPYAVISGVRIIVSKDIDVIYATSPPTTSLLIGYLLKMLTGKPLVIDYRDPWTFNPFHPYTSVVRERVEKWLEYQVIRKVDNCIVVTKRMQESLNKAYSQLNSGKFVTITNGFDGDDFAGCRAKKFDKFTFLYTGTFYGMRSPECFLLAFKGLKEENRDFKENSQFLFFGHIDRDIKKRLGKLDLINLVNCPIQYLKYRENYRHLMGADVLVLIMSAKSELTIPYKLFDYFSTGKPILALAPRGATSDIIEETRAGIVIPPEDVDKIKTKILWLYEKYKNTRDDVSNKELKLEKYSYSFLSQQLANLLDCF